jgi:polyhydroxybutyrate depolymerase
MKLHLLIAPAFLAVAALSSVAVAAAPQTMTWTIEGVERKALIFAPARGGEVRKAPLVFCFHGHGGNMMVTSQLMHIQTVWPEAIVVYPQGLPTPGIVHDPQGLRPGWQHVSGQVGDRDLKFFDEMLKTLSQTYSVDAERVYTTGFSNGAVFSYLLWAERGKKLAAVGVCAGVLWPTEHPTEQRAVVAVAGQSDQTLPFTDQQQTIETARQIDGATGQGHPCGPASTQYTCTLYNSPHTPVETLIHSGGHVYPPWAPDEIVNFFKAHKRP